MRRIAHTALAVALIAAAVLTGITTSAPPVHVGPAGAGIQHVVSR